MFKNFSNFTGKQLCWGIFWIKPQARRAATSLKRDSNAGVFQWTLQDFYEELFWKKNLQTTSFKRTKCFCLIVLTHLFPMHPFPTSWKNKKALRFWYFQRAQKGYVGNEWVKNQCNRFLEIWRWSTTKMFWNIWANF